MIADPPYGHAQNFRPIPEQGSVLPPSRVYAFNPVTGAVSVLADDFAMCNGVAFSPDFKTVYVTDTGDESVSHPSAALQHPQLVHLATAVALYVQAFGASLSQS
jgi:gluconolactonase